MGLFMHTKKIATITLAICLFLSLNNSAYSKCVYEIEEDRIELKWTGYKFTDKAPVSGTFDKINFKQNKESSSLKELFKSISFKLDSSSINSGLKIRDDKLASILFVGSSDKMITGKVLDFDESAKKAKASISMNSHSFSQEFFIKSEGQKIEFKSVLDLNNFKMSAVLKKLAKACEKLHTGADGKSVTWPSVSINIKAKYKKTCT